MKFQKRNLVFGEKWDGDWKGTGPERGNARGANELAPPTSLGSNTAWTALAASQVTQERAPCALALRGGSFFKILIPQYDSY